MSVDLSVVNEAFTASLASSRAMTSSTHTHADDTIIMAENPNELQLALNALNDNCQAWKTKNQCRQDEIAKPYTRFLVE